MSWCSDCVTVISQFFTASFLIFEYVQECESEGANKMMSHLGDLVSKSKSGDKYGKFMVNL